MGHIFFIASILTHAWCWLEWKMYNSGADPELLVGGGTNP